MATRHEHGRQGFTLRAAFAAIYQRQTFITLLFAVVAAGVLAFSLLRTPSYKAEARLVIHHAPDSAVTTDAAQRDAQDALRIIESVGVAETVVDRVGSARILGEVAPPRSRAVRRVMHGLRARTDRESDVIRVQMSARTPALAEDLLSEVIDVYIDRHDAIFSSSIEERGLVERHAHLKAELARIDEQLSEVRERDAGGGMHDRLSDLSARLAAVEGDLDRAESERAAAAARVEALRTSVAATPEREVFEETGGVSPAVETIRTHLAELRLQESRLVQNFEETSRVVLSIREQIASAEALLAAEPDERVEVREGPSELHRELSKALIEEEADLEARAGECEAMARRRATIKRDLFMLASAGDDRARLERDRQILAEAYAQCLATLEQSRLRNASSQGQARVAVVDRPSRSPRPDAALPPAWIAAALGMALLLSLMVGCVSGLLDPKIYRAEQAEGRLDRPVLASVPVLPEGARPRSVNGRWEPARGADTALEPLIQHVLSEGAESGRGPVVGVVAASRGEGASSIAAGLALGASRAGWNNVLLADLDYERPMAHDLFVSPVSPGTADVLAGGKASVAPARVDEERFFLLPAGTRAARRGELDRTRLMDLTEDCRERWDLTVLDLPPLEEGRTVAMLGACDLVILVVGAGARRHQVLSAFRDLIERTGSHCAGLVLNRRRDAIPEWLYRRL